MKNDTSSLDSKPLCDVCGQNEAKGVASSSLGPASVTFCQTCLDNRAEPLWAVDYIKGVVPKSFLDKRVLDMTTFKNGQYIKLSSLL